MKIIDMKNLKEGLCIMMNGYTYIIENEEVKRWNSSGKEAGEYVLDWVKREEKDTYDKKKLRSDKISKIIGYENK